MEFERCGSSEEVMGAKRVSSKALGKGEGLVWGGVGMGEVGVKGWKVGDRERTMSGRSF